MSDIPLPTVEEVLKTYAHRIEEAYDRDALGRGTFVENIEGAVEEALTTLQAIMEDVIVQPGEVFVYDTDAERDRLIERIEKQRQRLADRLKNKDDPTI